MAGKDDEMFMTRSFKVNSSTCKSSAPKTTEQHLGLIARSDKFVAYVTHNLLEVLYY